MSEVGQQTIAFLRSQKDVIDCMFGMSVIHEELKDRIYGELAVVFEQIEKEYDFSSIRLLASYVASDLKITRPGRPENEFDNCGLHVILFELDDHEVVEAVGIIVDNTSNHAVDTHQLTKEQIKSFRLRNTSSFN